MSKCREGNNKKGFTLIELLVVVGITAVLGTVTVVVINPVELLKQSRDATRLSDLASMNNAFAMLLVENPNAFLSTTLGKAYISVPSTNNCADLGLSAQYACAATSTFTNTSGTGWIPLNLTSLSSGSPLSRLPIDPVNSATSSLYYVFVANPSGTFKLSSILESQKYLTKMSQDGGTTEYAYEIGSDMSLGAGVFPQGWVKVPGNTAYGTSDFWVMKYEAKCANLTDPSTGLTVPSNGWGSYHDTNSPCTTANGKSVVSIQTGNPITYIFQNNAALRCANIGSGFHLVTNEEFMTMARNIEQQPINWSGNAVGSGYLYSGHNDDPVTYFMLQASSDSDPYYGTGNTPPSNQRRTFTLSNGSVIWDLAGNARETVQRTSANIQTIVGLPSCSDNVAGWGWCEYSSVAPYISAWTVDYPQSYIGPSNTSWNSTQGVGKVQTYKNGTNPQGGTVILRGGHAYDGANAGLFFASFAWDGGGSWHSHVGFRCAK